MFHNYMMSILNMFKFTFLFILLFAVSTGATYGESSTSFAVGKYAQDNKTGQYANHLNLSEVLTVPGADELEVTVIGSVEKCCQSNKVTKRCCDYLTIYDHNWQEIGKYSGAINEEFTVAGASIRVAFRSDNRTTDEGVRVEISERLPVSVFNEIKSQLLEVTKQFLKQGTKKAYLKIDEHLQLFKTLQTKVDETKNVDSIINEITVALISVARAYQEIAAMNKEIMAIHKTQFEIYEELKEKTSYNISKFEKKKQGYLSELNEDQTQLPNIKNSLEKQKKKVSIGAGEKIIQHIQAQQMIWNAFYEAQKSLETKLRTHSENIGLLLHTLGTNAQIYEQYANVVLLRKSTISTLDNIINLAELKKTVADIDASEKEIKQQLKKIEQIGL